MMNELLFITYFWPPSVKATLHFPLKICNLLPEYNWLPTILTVNQDTFSHKDDSLLNEVNPLLKVVKTNVFEPFNIYRKFIGKEINEPLIASETISKENKDWKHRLSIWIRMNLFIPDARIGWYPYAVKAGKKLISNNKFKAIITVGPPHSTHLIGNRLSQKFKIPHIAILIDPWLDIIYYKGFDRSKITLAVDSYFEKKVMNNASQIVFVTESTREDYVRKYPTIKNKSIVMYWGYNEDDFKEVKKTRYDEKKILLHAGNIFDYQNPVNLWNELKTRINKGENIYLRFLGTVSPEIKTAINNAGLSDRTEYLGYLSYGEMIKEVTNADYLLVCTSEKRHVPGKLFEYLRSGNPILAYGDDNEEVNRILKKQNAGVLFPYDNNGAEFFDNAAHFKTVIENVLTYDRRKIINTLVEKLKTYVNTNSIK